MKGENNEMQSKIEGFQVIGFLKNCHFYSFLNWISLWPNVFKVIIEVMKTFRPELLQIMQFQTLESRPFIFSFKRKHFANALKRICM